MEKEKRTDFFKSIMNGKKIGKDQFIIFIMVGILLIVIAIPVSDNSSGKDTESVFLDNKNDIMEVGKETEKINEYVKSENNGVAEEYESYMENKLEQAISSMEGAGKVKVMITVNSSEELVVEKDGKAVSNSTVENDSEGGSRNANESNSEEETVYLKKSDGSESPYVIKKIRPVIEGIVVVAQGGARPEVSENITEAIVALFDIEPHKIKVVKMKSE